jgi:hypothetical protein
MHGRAFVDHRTRTPSYVDSSSSAMKSRALISGRE